MDPVTLIVIASMNGRPLIMQREVPAARCEARAHLARARAPAALAWNSSRVAPPTTTKTGRIDTCRMEWTA